MGQLPLRREGPTDLRRFGAKRRHLAVLLVSTAALAALLFAFFTDFPLRRDPQGDGLLGSRYPIRVELAPQKTGQNADRMAASAVTASAAEADNMTAEDLAEEGIAPRSSPEGPAAAPAASNPPSLLAVDFDLSPDASGVSTSGGQQLEIAKPLMVNGREAGKVALRVGRHSLLYLEREGLARALRQADQSLAERISGSAQPFVSFDELRDSGIAVRYDPVADAVRLES